MRRRVFIFGDHIIINEYYNYYYCLLKRNVQQQKKLRRRIVRTWMVDVALVERMFVNTSCGDPISINMVHHTRAHTRNTHKHLWVVGGPCGETRTHCRRRRRSRRTASHYNEYINLIASDAVCEVRTSRECARTSRPTPKQRC